MNEHIDLELRLRTWLEEEGPDDVPRRVVDVAIEEAIASRRRRPLPGALHSLLTGVESLGIAARAPKARAVIATGLLLALLAGTLVAGMFVLDLERMRGSGPIAFDMGGDIWIVSGRRGDEPVRRTSTIGLEEAAPMWSPDGRHLAYWVTDVDHAEVHVLDVERGSVRVLHEPDGMLLPLHDRIFGWSPDSRRIAVPARGSSRSGDSTVVGIEGVAIIDVESGAAEPIPVEGSAWSFGWSPDGRYLGIVGEARLFVFDVDARTLLPLLAGVDGGGTSQIYWMRDIPPVFSNDSASVLFTDASERDGNGGDILSVRIGSDTAEAIATSDSNELAPMPSRDGTWLAFARSVAVTLDGALAKKGIGSSSEILIMPTAGGDARPVAEGVWPHAVWSPDERRLVTKSFDHSELVIIDVDRPDKPILIPVAEGSSVGSYSWGPQPP